MNKIIVVTIAAIFLSSGVLAQTVPGLEAGLNISNIKERNSGGVALGNNKEGLKCGALLEERLSKRSNFYLQEGLFFSSKGAKFTGNSELTENYLEIPFQVLYKSKTFKGNYVITGIGVYGGLAISGKFLNGYANTTTKLNIGSSPNDDIKKADFGLSLHSGYQFGCGLFFHIQYQIGLINIDPIVNTQYNYGNGTVYWLTNNTLTITLGGLFSKEIRTKKPGKKTVPGR